MWEPASAAQPAPERPGRQGSERVLLSPRALSSARAFESRLWLPELLTLPRACARADGHGQRGAPAQPVPPVRRAAQPEAPQHGGSTGAALHGPRTGRNKARCMSRRPGWRPQLPCRDVVHASAEARACVGGSAGLDSNASRRCTGRCCLVLFRSGKRDAQRMCGDALLGAGPRLQHGVPFRAAQQGRARLKDQGQCAGPG